MVNPASLQRQFMSQELPSKQWTKLSMFSRQRVLCFVYVRRKVDLISQRRNPVQGVRMAPGTHETMAIAARIDVR
jgi:hypothetical protein